jgi:hypothetical protein
MIDDVVLFQVAHLHFVVGENQSVWWFAMSKCALSFDDFKVVKDVQVESVYKKLSCLIHMWAEMLPMEMD